MIPSPDPASRVQRPGLAGLAPDELAAWLAARGQPAYRARQVADAFWVNGCVRLSEILTLPAPLRIALDDAFRVDTLASTTLRTADGGLTEKALHRLDDGRSVESVLMRYPARGSRRGRNTVCLSSQVGCAVGCPFCATGELGFGRDLAAAEIVDQARFWRRRLAAEGTRVTNIVFMGMGEPLLNVDRVLAAAEALTDPGRFGLAARGITISTSGVLPGMEQLIARSPQWTLAVSIHAARPVLRDLLVPLNRRWPVGEVVAAADRYAVTTGRRVSYEVVLIDGINDTPADARALAGLLRRRLAHVNLIPMNPVAHTPWQPSGPARTAGFAEILRADRLSVTVRRNRGLEIGGACGQLAAELTGAPSPVAVERRRERLARASAEALGLDHAGLDAAAGGAG